MKKRALFVWCCLLLNQPVLWAQQAVKPLTENKINLFPLSAVRITDKQFHRIQELDHQYLLSLEPDRLLSWFRREAGLTPKAQPYPYWESENLSIGPLAGHMMGFYMSSMAMMYQTTGDAKIIERLKYTLAGLKEAQDAHGDGYLLATRKGKQVFEEVVAGKIKTTNPLINDTWEPIYIMNKIMLGLNGVYTQCGLEEAKPILIKMADWFGSNLIDKLTHDQMQEVLVCEHGSINESFVDVYKITGDKKYLTWAEKLNDEDMWVPLSKGNDILQGWHANTQIPKFTGFTAEYRYNGNQAMYNAANLFWNIVTKKHTWINGGNSSGEHFFPESEFEKKVPYIGGPESCNSVNMMRLTEALYQADGKPERVDYYEKVLLNHILANFDPEKGMSTYYTPMRPGTYKIHATEQNSFYCCVGTGIEAPAKFARMTYAYKNNALYVNLFMSSVVNWREKGISVEQNTRFPDENSSVLTLTTAAPQILDIKIRKPFWAENEGFVLQVNGKKAKAEESEGGYLTISRKWSNGDKIKISFVPRIEIKPLQSSTRYYSITYGPLVMATKMDNTNIEKSDYWQPRNTVANVTIPMSEVPVLIGSVEEIKRNLKQLPGNELKLNYSPKEEKPIELIPFNRIHFSRYALYFIHVANMDEYKRTVQSNEKYNGIDPKVAAMGIDSVKIGNKDSEEAHKMETLYSMTQKNDHTTYWRRSSNGGYFTYNLKSLPDAPQSLFLAFRVSDQDESVFDLLVDGRVIKTYTHIKDSVNLATTYYSEIIPIPVDLLKGKKDITVKIAARLKNKTGEVLAVRLLRTE